MNDSGMELVLSQYLGKDVLVWAKQLLNGSPLLLGKSSGDEITDQKRIQQNILFLLNPLLCFLSNLIELGLE